MAKRTICITFLLCLCLCLLPCYAQAASTTDAKEPIDTGRDCTLSLIYGYDNTAFADIPVFLYQFAEISADFQYTFTPDFADTNLVINGIQSAGEWNVIRGTLTTHILANAIEAGWTAKTDASGQAHFEELKPGLYLATVDPIIRDDFICTFDAVLITLPGLQENGAWQYEVSVAAKPQILPDEKIQLKVLKLWKDDGKQSDRPESITVEIFRDKTSYETVVLSESNHWSYSWSADADGASWTVVERNIPSGYTMTVETRGTSFVITNTRSDTPQTPPSQTGDTMNIGLYVTLMYLSGAALVILGLTGKRNAHEK